VLTEPILPTDTTGDLLDRLAHAGAKLLVDTMDGIESGVLEARPQPAEGVSTASKLSPEDAHVDWSAPALRVDRLVRACTPAPGAWTTFRGERLKLGPVRLATGAAPMVPGELRVTKRAVLAGTGSHPVALGDVQPPGKRRMTSMEWARGVRLSDADRLGA
jgi:methionyl-tRNA formyltransferase